MGRTFIYFGKFEDPHFLFRPPFLSILALVQLLQMGVDHIYEDVNAGTALKHSYLSCLMFCCF